VELQFGKTANRKKEGKPKNKKQTGNPFGHGGGASKTFGKLGVPPKKQSKKTTGTENPKKKKKKGASGVSKTTHPKQKTGKTVGGGGLVKKPTKKREKKIKKAQTFPTQQNGKNRQSKPQFFFFRPGRGWVWKTNERKTQVGSDCFNFTPFL